MSRNCIPLLVVLLVLGTALTVVADTVENEWGIVDFGWEDAETFNIHIHNIPDVPKPEHEIDTSMFGISNRRGGGDGVWGMVKDETWDFIGFPSTMEDYNLSEVGINVNTFVPYHELALTIPSEWNGWTLIAEGDPLEIALAWINFNDPLFSFTVPGYVPPPPPPPPPPEPEPEPPPPPMPELKAFVEKNEDGSAIGIIIKNVGDAPFKGPLKVTAGLSYNQDWYAESVTQFFTLKIDALVLVPGAALPLSIRANGDGSYSLSFPTIRSSEEPLTFTIPAPQEEQILAFEDMIYNWWTGYKDPDPDNDYTDVTISMGDASVHNYFSIEPYFPPPR